MENRDDSSDSEVEAVLDKRGKISIDRLRKKHPSLLIKAIGGQAGGDDVWNCPLCPDGRGATFMSNESLVEHLKVHNRDDEDDLPR